MPNKAGFLVTGAASAAVAFSGVMKPEPAGAQESASSSVSQHSGPGVLGGAWANPLEVMDAIDNIALPVEFTETEKNDYLSRLESSYSLPTGSLQIFTPLDKAALIKALADAGNIISSSPAHDFFMKKFGDSYEAIYRKNDLNPARRVAEYEQKLLNQAAEILKRAGLDVSPHLVNGLVELAVYLADEDAKNNPVVIRGPTGPDGRILQP